MQRQRARQSQAWLEDVPKPEIDQRRSIRVYRTGICGTDVHAGGITGETHKGSTVPL
jgi:threonine dehydrogenase-like Zn-dependent dehydrogenase